MSNQIDFSNGSDTGEALPDAIQPIEDGEVGFAIVFNRLSANFSNRTEVLRRDVNEGRFLRDLDRALLYRLDGANGITWNGTQGGGGTGDVVLGVGTALRIIPIVTPGDGRAATAYFENVGTVFPGRLARLDLPDGGGNTIRVVSDKEVWEGGNETTISITDVPGSGAVAVTVGGDGTVPDPSTQPGKDNITVTYDSTLSHDIGDILTAVNGDPVATTLVTLSLSSGVDTDPAFDVAETGLTAGLDGVYHEITQAQLAAFFAASTDNLLNEGDTLAIWYGSASLRRESTEENGTAAIPAASLVNLSREPEKAQFCVPIGKVLNDTFVLPSGATLVKASTVTTLSTSADLRADVNKPLGAPPAPGANTYGTELVGTNAGALTNSSPGADDLQTALVALDTLAGAADAQATTNDARLTTVEGNIIPAVEFLWEINVLADGGQEGVFHRAPSLKFPRYTTYGAGGADTGILVGYAGASTLIDGNGSNLYTYDGTDVQGLEIETEADLFGGAPPTVSNVVDLSVNSSYVAVIDTSASTFLTVFEDESSTPRTVNAVTPDASGTLLRVAARADNVAYVVLVRFDGANYDWVVRDYDMTVNPPALSATVPFINNEAADTDWEILGFDVIGSQSAKALAYIMAEDSGGSTTNLHTITYRGGVPTEANFTIGGASTEGVEVIATDDLVYVIGRAFDTSTGILGADFDIVAFRHEATGLDDAVFGVNAVDLTDTGASAAYYDSACSDGRFIYGVITNDDTGNRLQIDVLDMQLNRVNQITAGANLIDITTDGEYLYALTTGGVVYRWITDTSGGTFRYVNDGVAPVWTKHAPMGL